MGGCLIHGFEEIRMPEILAQLHFSQEEFASWHACAFGNGQVG